MDNNIVLALSFEYTFLEFYKQLCLDENDVVVIFMIKHLIEQNNVLITADLLSIKMNLDVKIIDNILVKLIKKGYIKYLKSQSDQLMTTIEPLKKKLSELYQLEINKSSLKELDEKTSKITKNIYEIFESELGRTLSPVEFSLIDDWIANGISEDECIDALHEAINQNITSLKFIDKILMQNQIRNDIQNVGYSAISNSWKKNADETINIIKNKINKND